MSRSILQLIPGAPPLVNGVGDYALTVARALRSDWGIESTFLVCSPVWDGPDAVDGFKLIPLRLRRGLDLCQAIERNLWGGSEPLFVLLQLSPYGFDTNGSPFWLFDGLRRWKAGNVRAHQLVTYFHELYATSVPWRRGFWVSPLQRFCAREFAKLSDIALTNMKRYVDRLERWDPSKAGLIPMLPVVSSVGEPTNPGALQQRRRRLVVWGSAAAKREIYTRHLRVIEDAVRIVGIECIIDIGSRWPETPGQIAGTAISLLDVVPARIVSEILADSVIAACSYHPNYLGKSSIYAALCAHRIPAIVLPTHAIERSDRDGLRIDTHFITSISPDAGHEPVIEKLERIAAEAHAWYAGHTSSTHARVIAQVITEIQAGVVMQGLHRNAI